MANNSKVATFNGNTYNFPADATDAEIDEAMNAAHPAGSADPVAAAKALPQPSAWDYRNTPLVPPSLMPVNPDTLKHFADSPPSEFDVQHPIIGGLTKGFAHAISDAENVASSSTSGTGAALAAANILTKGGSRVPRVAGRLLAGGTGASIAGSSALDLADRDWTSLNPDEMQANLMDLAGISGGVSQVAEGGKGFKGIAPKTAGKVMNMAVDAPRESVIGSNMGDTLVKQGIKGTKKGMLTQIRDQRPDLRSTVLDAAQKGDARSMEQSLGRYRDLNTAEGVLSPQVTLSDKTFTPPRMSDYVAGAVSGIPAAMMGVGDLEHGARIGATIGAGMLAKRVLGSPYVLSNLANFLGEQSPISPEDTGFAPPAQTTAPSPQGPPMLPPGPSAVAPRGLLPTGSAGEIPLAGESGVMYRDEPPQYPEGATTGYRRNLKTAIADKLGKKIPFPKSRSNPK